MDLEGVNDGVEQRGPAVRPRQVVHRGQEPVAVPFVPGDDEDPVVERQQAQTGGSRQVPEEAPDGAPQQPHRRAHAGAEIDGQHEVHVRRLEERDLLPDPVLVEGEVVAGQPVDEAPAPIPDRHRDEHRAGPGREERDGAGAREDAAHHPPPPAEARRHADHVRLRPPPRVPGALERRGGDHADPRPVDEELDRLDLVRRGDVGAQPHDAGELALVVGLHDGQHGVGLGGGPGAAGGTGFGGRNGARRPGERDADGGGARRVDFHVVTCPILRSGPPGATAGPGRPRPPRSPRCAPAAARGRSAPTRGSVPRR